MIRLRKKNYSNKKGVQLRSKITKFYNELKVKYFELK